MIPLLQTKRFSNRTHRLSVFIAQFILGPLLFTLLTLGLTPSAQASHYRYGNITWTTVSSDPTNRTLQFRVSVSYRTSYSVWAGTIVPGAVVNDGYDFNFGDGTSVPLSFTVTSVNGPGDYFFAEAILTKTYASNGDFTAYFASGSRFSSLQNNSNANYYVSTIAQPGSGNRSPVATLPPIVNLPAGQANASFQIRAFDADNDPLTFSLPSSAELVGITFTQPSGFAVSPSGLATFSTAGASNGQLFSAIVKVSDGKTFILLDFLIRIGGTGNPPAFAYGGITPNDGSVISVSSNSVVTFTVRATDPDATDQVDLQAYGLPAGANFSPALPASGTPTASTVFTWTPTSPGSTVVAFAANDPSGNQGFTSVTINVTPPLNVGPASGMANACIGSASSNQYFTVSGTNLINDVMVTAPAGFEISTQTATGFASSLMLTQTAGNVPTTTLYVRISAGLTTGAKSGNVTLVSGANSALIGVSGMVNAPPANPSLVVSGPITCAQTSVILTASSSSAGSFSYAFGGPGASNANPTAGTATANVAGTYSVTVADLSTGCANTTTTSVQTNTVSPAAVSISPSNPAFGCTVNSITLTAAPSGASYRWDDSSTQATRTISATGTYSLTVTGGNGCTASTSTAIGEGNITLPTITLVFNSSAMVIGTGTPTITVPSTPGQQFRALGGNSYEFMTVVDRINGYEIREKDSNTTGVFVIKRMGSFSVTVLADNGCSRTVQGIITVAP